MGYEIRYGNLNLTEQEKEDKAIQDCWDWLSEEQKQIVINGLSACQEFHEIDRWNIAIGFAGIEGYPVRCLIKRYCGGQRVLEEWSKVDHWEAGHSIEPFKDINTPNMEGGE